MVWFCGWRRGNKGVSFSDKIVVIRDYLVSINYNITYADQTTNNKTIDTLPEGFTLEDVIEKLIVIDKIDKGLQDIKEGKTYTSDEVKEITSKW